jgi:hypothetical protein
MSMLIHEARDGLAEALRSRDEARTYRGGHSQCEQRGCGREMDQTLIYRPEGGAPVLRGYCDEHLRRAKGRRWWEDPPARPVPARATRAAPLPAAPPPKAEYRGLSPAARRALNGMPNHTGNGHC